jgi:hypothetical protein
MNNHNSENLKADVIYPRYFRRNHQLPDQLYMHHWRSSGKQLFFCSGSARLSSQPREETQVFSCFPQFLQINYINAIILRKKVHDRFLDAFGKLRRATI